VLDFDWRWIQVGQQVTVHDDSTSPSVLQPATVAFVDRRTGSTRVGVRIVPAVDAPVIWPTQQQVHPVPPNPAEPCWRCVELAAAEG